MKKVYLDRYNLPYSLREDFLKGIDKIYNEVVEVHLGNHLGDNKHGEKKEKREQGAKENPFIDTTTWQWILDKKRQDAYKCFAEDPL